jgi:hypothetical protein
MIDMQWKTEEKVKKALITLNTALNMAFAAWKEAVGTAGKAEETAEKAGAAREAAKKAIKAARKVMQTEITEDAVGKAKIEWQVSWDAWISAADFAARRLRLLAEQARLLECLIMKAKMMRKDVRYMAKYGKGKS